MLFLSSRIEVTGAVIKYFLINKIMDQDILDDDDESISDDDEITDDDESILNEEEEL